MLIYTKQFVYHSIAKYLYHFFKTTIMRKSFMLLCTFFLCLTLFGQTGNKVTGEVSSLKDGRGINASVLIKGASKGVPTSADGKYSIDNVSSSAVLIFSAVGYKTLEISVKGRSVVNAALEVDQQ